MLKHERPRCPWHWCTLWVGLQVFFSAPAALQGSPPFTAAWAQTDFTLIARGTCFLRAVSTMVHLSRKPGKWGLLNLVFCFGLFQDDPSSYYPLTNSFWYFWRLSVEWLRTSCQVATVWQYISDMIWGLVERLLLSWFLCIKRICHNSGDIPVVMGICCVVWVL